MPQKTRSVRLGHPSGSWWWLRLGALCGAIGLAMTIALAGASSLWAPVSSYPTSSGWERFSSSISVSGDRGSLPEGLLCETDAHSWLGIAARARFERSQRYNDSGELEVWDQGQWVPAVDRPRFESRDFSIDRVQAGWPWPALVGAAWRSTAYSTSPTNPEQGLVAAWRVIADPQAPRWLIGESRLIPFAPLWRGLVLDTLVFGGPLMVLLVAQNRGRVWRRQRHGQCLVCGYDLRGSGVDHARCPECGSQRDGQSSAATK